MPARVMMLSRTFLEFRAKPKSVQSSIPPPVQIQIFKRSLLMTLYSSLTRSSGLITYFQIQIEGSRLLRSQIESPQEAII